MSELPRILDAIGRLLSYPDEHTVQASEYLFVLLQGELPEASQAASTFGSLIETKSVHDLEELYSQTFDINPACALEVGWHLFGEEYARGLFLVRLRAEMQVRKLEESTELPDHIIHVLAIVAAMPRDEALRFVHACMLPAVDKMFQKLSEAKSPYQHILHCLAQVLEREFGRPEAPVDDSGADGEASDQKVPAAPVDLLQSFPMPNQTCDSSNSIEFVPLQMDFHHDSDVSAASVDLREVGVPRHDDSIPFMLRDKVRHGGSNG